MERKGAKLKKYLVALGGPTAVGKTTTSIKVALHFQTEILSADSRQIYKEINIGTAKPSKDELNTVPHHFIDHISIHDGISVGKYERECLEKIKHLFRQYPCLIMTGGTGLYFKAVLQGLDDYPEVPAEIYEHVEDRYRKEGIEYLQEYLQTNDLVYYLKVDIHNPHRLLRAVSVMEASGKPFSSFQGKSKTKRDFEVIRILLELPREELYERIDRRVIHMIESGLLEEARSLYMYRTLRPLNTVGYKELFQHIDGDISLEEAISLIQRNSRRYAKRQMTWFNNQGNWKKFHPGDTMSIISYIENAMC